MAAGYAYPWMIFSANALYENGFPHVAELLRGRPWDDVPAEEIAVAYDFLGDLFVETDRDDVQRTVLFLGRCQQIGFGLAFAEAATLAIRVEEPQAVVITNRRVRRAELRGELARAMKESLARQRREERRAAKARRERMTARS
ncbi:MAG TPA: hypothetical protein VGN57_15895 [Pirellulaceae bacterium]|jgi:hypothetical protein|nr:hypothetical protein [Pirellulaceae bacterium]